MLMHSVHACKVIFAVLDQRLIQLYNCR